MSKKILRIATRKSPLALWQANHVREMLLQHWPKLHIELIPMVTSGDKFINYKPTHDYIGKRTLSLRYDRNPNGSFVYKKASTYAVGGIGYFLSRKSAEIIVNYKDFQAEETDRSEDCIVGKILRKHSIKPEEMIDLSKHGKI